MLPIRELADTWSSLYANSALLRSVVSFAHVGGLVTGGGYAIASDLDLLRSLRRGGLDAAPQLARLQAAHRIVISGLALVIISGFLLMFADLDAYLESTVFWIKMTLVACLLVNGALLARTARREAGARLRLMTLASLTLWLTTTFVGAVVPNAL